MKNGYVVTGPGTDKTYKDPGPAVSYAQTRASRHDGEASFYVRDPSGSLHARVDREEDGRVYVYGRQALS